MALATIARGVDPPPVPVSEVDLKRFCGTWYEIAAFPTWFERGCVGSTLTCELTTDGNLRLITACHKETLDGPLHAHTGDAWVTDPATNAKLKVQFFWPLRAQLWVLDLDPRYRYAAVGRPNREHLWILSRTPRMSLADYDVITRHMQAMGFDTSRLTRTLQPEVPQTR